MQSAVKQNYHVETEGDINKLINLKLNASYTYLALVRSFFFNVTVVHTIIAAVFVSITILKGSNGRLPVTLLGSWTESKRRRDLQLTSI